MSLDSTDLLILETHTGEVGGCKGYYIQTRGYNKEDTQLGEEHVHGKEKVVLRESTDTVVSSKPPT